MKKVKTQEMRSLRSTENKRCFEYVYQVLLESVWRQDLFGLSLIPSYALPFTQLFPEVRSRHMCFRHTSSRRPQIDIAPNAI